MQRIEFMRTELIEQVKTTEYKKFKKNLRHSVCLEGVIGPYAYGVGTNARDIKIRGCYLPTKREILSANTLNAIEASEIDITLFPVSVFCNLLAENNIDLLELLGLPKENYLRINTVGKLILDNRSLFLTQRTVSSTRGVISSEVKRIKRHHEISEMAAKTAESSLIKKTNEFNKANNSDVKLFFDKTGNISISGKIRDVNIGALFQYVETVNNGEMLLNKYLKPKTMALDVLCKKMANVIRLYYMILHLLKNGEIITLNPRCTDTLIKILNGDMLDKNNNPNEDFYNMVEMLEDRIDILARRKTLPAEVNTVAVSELVEKANSNIKFRRTIIGF
jgi:hypothetical protein